MAEILGYTPEEMENESPEKFHLSYNNFIEFGDKYYWQLSKSRIVQVEYPLKHKEGHTVWCMFSGMAIAPPDLSMGAVWAIDDITERKKSERALRESEEKLRSYIENAPDGVFVSDKSGDCVEVNPAACKITGYTKEELLRKHITDLIPEYSHDVARAHFDRLLREGESHGEMPFINKAGEKREWSVDAVKISEDRYLGFVKDVTERKRSEEALGQRESQMNLILNSSAEFVLYYNRDMRVIWANRAAANYVKMTEEQMIGLSCSEIWHNDGESCSVCPINEVKVSKVPQKFEQEKNDGKYLYLRLYPVFDDDGEVMGLLSSARILPIERKYSWL